MNLGKPIKSLRSFYFWEKNIKIYKLYLYVNVLVQFYLWFKIYFSLLWGKVMYDNKLEIEPQHWHLILVLLVFVWAQEMCENAQFMEYKAPTKWDVIIYTPLVG